MPITVKTIQKTRGMCRREHKVCRQYKECD